MPITRRVSWEIWWERCALTLTPPEVREELITFAAQRFRLYLERYAHRSNTPDAVRSLPPAADCWHQFETWCALHTRRDGKRYKDWLLARGASDAAAVESGASLLLRDSVRNWLRQEFGHRAQSSLDAPLNEAGLRLADLLPCETSTEPDAEMRAWQEAQCAEALPQRLAVAVLARARGVPLSHPEVLRAAACGKSVLSELYRAYLLRLGKDFARCFPGTPPDTATQVVLEALHRISHRVFFQFPPESPLVRFLATVEPTHD